MSELGWGWLARDLTENWFREGYRAAGLDAWPPSFALKTRT
jgi:hypothetical protein